MRYRCPLFGRSKSFVRWGWFVSLMWLEMVQPSPNGEKIIPVSTNTVWPPILLRAYFFFYLGIAMIVMGFIAFCAFFARIVCTAVMLDHGGIWNTVGSGRRGASTEGSSTCSDGRGWAVEKGFLVCHPFSHSFRLSTSFVGCLYVWIE